MYIQWQRLMIGTVWAMTFGATAGSFAAETVASDRFITQARQLTFEGRRAGEGYFSPDGAHLIFQSERYPGNPFFQIHTLDLTTGRVRLISPGFGRTTCSFFRPGTDQVLFASTHLDPRARDKQKEEYAERNNPTRERRRWDYDEHYDIFATDSRGRNPLRLTETLGYDAECAYSPDGELIVFASNRQVYPTDQMSPEDQARFERSPAHFCEIYLMNADGSQQRRLTEWPGEDGGPFFTPDGRRIIWRHFEENGLLCDVYTMKLDGSDRRKLTDFKCMSWAPYMHPSGDYFAFGSNKLGFANFEIYIAAASGEKQPVRVTHTDGFDGLPVFAPGGKTFSWTSGRNTPGRGRAQLFLADWDHQAALAAVRAAPSRGTPEPESSAHVPNGGWEAGPPPKAKGDLKPAITSNDLYAHVSFLAADALEGRMTGTKGVNAAGEYIAARFKEAGLIPLGDNGSYFQEFPFPQGVEMIPEKNELGFTDNPHATTFDPLTPEQDFRPLSFTANAAVHSELVFVGYGLVVPEEKGQGKYDSYAGLDVAGKIVLVLDDVPQKLETEQRIRYGLYSNPRYKAMQAKQHGATGFLLVVGPNTPGAGELLSLSRSASDAGIVAACLTVDAANRLLQQSGKNLGEWQTLLDTGSIPDDFKGVTKTYVGPTMHLERREGRCRNVVGMLPGTGDDERADEFIVFGAHYDHIGHGEAGGSRALAGEEGQIHNGADDNASGTATVLELAAALAQAHQQAGDHQPRRGTIFACWSGEEIGIIGSSYFAQHAPCPLDRIKAYVNFDMVGRMQAGKLLVQAVGSSPQWRSWIERINVRVPLNLSLQDDPYLPTDTTAFYPAGVPVLSMFTDIHDDYNRPTDDADTLNYLGMTRIARFARELGIELVQRATSPAYAEVKRATPKGGGGGRRRIFTGTVPDFAAGNVAGMKISGVSGDSPAQKAGLQGGDIIIEFAGQEIRSLEDYSVVLNAVKPDQAVSIVVLRDDKQVKLQITPTVRK
ncbi:MAG: M28 family peptidase [bacterium]|nr:M28 family peptidase [bacterium]